MAKEVFRFVAALMIALFSCSALAANESEFPDLKGQIEQQVAFVPHDQAGAVLSVLLVNNGDNTYRLLTYLQNAYGVKKLFDLPNFWKGGGVYSGRGDYPAVITLSALDNGFAVAVRDPSSNKLNLDLKFNWQRGKFRLVEEKISATPQLRVQTSDSEVVKGRWTCMRDTDLLSGDIHVKSASINKLYSKKIKPVYLGDYAIEANYMEDICK